MFISQRAFFVIGDDDAPTASMHIGKFLQWFFFPLLCLRIGYRIRYLYGQFVLRHIEIHFNIDIVVENSFVVLVVSILAEQR